MSKDFCAAVCSLQWLSSNICGTACITMHMFDPTFACRSSSRYWRTVPLYRAMTLRTLGCTLQDMDIHSVRYARRPEKISQRSPCSGISIRHTGVYIDSVTVFWLFFVSGPSVCFGHTLTVRVPADSKCKLKDCDQNTQGILRSKKQLRIV